MIYQTMQRFCADHGTRRFACAGPKGEMGAVGDIGPPGPPGEPAPVSLITGSGAGAKATIPVYVGLITDDGRWLGDVGGTLTDEDGAFEIFVSPGVVPSSRAVVRAWIDDGWVRAPLTGAHVEVDPVSDAVLRLILQITETPGGRTLQDFTVARLAELVGTAREAVALASPASKRGLRRGGSSSTTAS